MAETDIHILQAPQRIPGTQIQIKSIAENFSKSFTIKNMSVEDVFYELFFYAQKLEKYGKNNIELVCYKEAKQNDEETIK